MTKPFRIQLSAFLWGGLFAVFFGVPAHTETTTEPETGSIYDVYDICDAYYEFLNMEPVSDSNDCEPHSKFLVVHKDESNILKTLSVYQNALK